jgi:hypothetical protein
MLRQPGTVLRRHGYCIQGSPWFYGPGKSLCTSSAYVSGDFWVSQYEPALRALLSHVDSLGKTVFFS